MSTFRFQKSFFRIHLTLFYHLYLESCSDFVYRVIKKAALSESKIYLHNFDEFRQKCTDHPDFAHLSAWAALTLASEQLNVSLVFSRKDSEASDVTDNAGAVPSTSTITAGDSATIVIPPSIISESFYSNSMADSLLRIHTELCSLLLVPVTNISHMERCCALPSGVLVTGKSGCGKSSFLRLLHRQTFSASTSLSSTPSPYLVQEISATTLISKEVGASERNLLHILQQASEKAKQTQQILLLLLDDIDRLFPADLETELGLQRYPSVTRRLLDVFLGSCETLLKDGLVLVATATDTDAVHEALLRHGRLEETLSF